MALSTTLTHKTCLFDTISMAYKVALCVRAYGRIASDAKTGYDAAAGGSRHGANHGRDRGQRLRTKRHWCAHRSQRHSFSPDRCMPTLRTQVGSRATRWWLRVFSWLDKAIYVDMAKLTEEERWL